MELSISRSIIESHGGRLTAQSNLTRGLTLEFTLPIRPGVAAMNTTRLPCATFPNGPMCRALIWCCWI
jgi:hypothetical protein